MSRQEENKSIPMEELVRPVGIVEVWQDAGNGKGRIFIPIFHKPGKDWWEFPGGRSSQDFQKEEETGLTLEVISEIYEESGLVVPKDADQIAIPTTAKRFFAESLEVIDKAKKRVIVTKPFIFRFACGKTLPIIELNKSGAVEVDDYFWMDMTSYY